MGRTYRHYSTDFKLGLIEAYLAGRGTVRSLSTTAGINHSLFYFWLAKYERGELTAESQHDEELLEAEHKIAAQERKVGQLTMELDLLKKRLIAVPALSSARSSIISGPAGSASSEDAA